MATLLAPFAGALAIMDVRAMAAGAAPLLWSTVGFRLRSLGHDHYKDIQQ